MTDILKDAPAYRWMTDDVREEEQQKQLEERQKRLEELRETVLAIVEGRFPKYTRLTKKLIRDATNTERLNHLIVKLSLAKETDNVEQYLLDIDEEEEEQITQ
jgi:hypothetical protein